MGNSSTKEQRSPRAGQGDGQGVAVMDSSPHALGHAAPTDQPAQYAGRRNGGRQNQPELLATLGVNPADAGGQQHQQGFEWRKETRQERDARRLERERVAREKERTRSMQEEHVDGGYLVTLGTYTGTEDFSKAIVRRLMIERRLAPFWKGLNDHQDSWTENQLVAVARGLPIPSADVNPTDSPKPNADGPLQVGQSSNANESSARSASTPAGVAIPQSKRAEGPSSSLTPHQSSPQASSGPTLHTPSLIKVRSKTMSAITGASKTLQPDPQPREMKLPDDQYVNGLRLEAQLYKDVDECPICFLYYPPYLNKTRCCDQSICSECFVQIKRPDPHPPEHADPSVPPPPPGEMQGREGELVSEPATCPFCKVPEFGVSFDPPPFKRGLVYANHMSNPAMARTASGISSSASLTSESSGGPSQPARRRGTSLSATSPMVITTDQVRPDWADRLAAARAHAARRSAAATALHTAAYLMGNRGQEIDLRGTPFVRRGLLRRTSGGAADGQGASSSQQNMLAMMSERGYRPHEAGVGSSASRDTREGGRRHRVEDLEEMMMMEAIRLSLASEEERRKREEKEAKKEAKKKEKEQKKADKAARKTGFYAPSNAAASASTSALAVPSSSSRSGFKENAPYSKDDSAARGDGTAYSASFSPQSHLERARAQIQNESGPSLSIQGISGGSQQLPLHLRTQSNVSSSTSSIDGASSTNEGALPDPRGRADAGSFLDASPAGSRINIPGSSSAAAAAAHQESFASDTPPGGGASTETTFNFSSLAQMVGEDEKHRTSATTEPLGKIPDSSSSPLASHHEEVGASHHPEEGESSHIGIVPQLATSPPSPPLFPPKPLDQEIITEHDEVEHEVTSNGKAVAQVEHAHPHLAEPPAVVSES